MMKQAYGEEACIVVLCLSGKHFAQGRESLEDDEHTGRLGMVRTKLKIKRVATLSQATLYLILSA
jgi:hypothetical protein